MDRSLLASALVALAACGQAQTAPTSSLQRVDDRADLLTPEAESRLASELAQLERRTTDQVQVVTVRSLGGKPIEEFSLELARAEGLGIRGKDNGVLVLVAPSERKVRIETGRGIAGALTDAEAASIVRSMVGQFRTGHMQQGIETGVHEIDRELSEEPVRPALLRKDEPWPG